MTRVAVLGAAGRMGTVACDAIDADPELELVSRIGRDDPLTALVEAGTEVAVELTTPQSVAANAAFCVEHAIDVVVGATGLTDADLDALRAGVSRSKSRVFVVPNFAIGAVLMMDFAARAAPHFARAEIVERHHDKKLDAPSGTAVRTAEMMAAARDEPWTAQPPAPDDEARGRDVSGVRVHSIRLPGSVAHQEIVLGGHAETLTIRHDSLDRSSFMPGLLLAIKKIRSVDGVVVGLENVLGL